MRFKDYPAIIRKAWKEYDGSKVVKHIEDISARVSTNHVFKIWLENDDVLIAKLSYFGRYEHFKEDHQIIHALANNLLYPFENVMAKSLMKNNKLFTYHYKDDFLDTWVVFYNPIRVLNKLPRRLDDNDIKTFAVQMAKFHQACFRAKNVLPKSSKTLQSDVADLLQITASERGQYEHRLNIDTIRRQCDLFLNNAQMLNYEAFDQIPVFVDWNIGNFSVNDKMELFSRWDYDWFRVSSRMLDFYFFSRVVSDVGDRTAFTYNHSPMAHERFVLFLQEYHRVYPLTANEVRFLKEAYRFFILNYVIKYGQFFFHRTYATQLQREVYQTHLPSLDGFDVDKLLKALHL